MNYDEQVQTFKGIIPIGQLPVSELIKLLRNQVDIMAIPIHTLPTHTMNFLCFNAVHCILNETLQIKTEDLSFQIFHIAENDKSTCYYRSMPSMDKPVYVVFEEHTGYISSNSNQLFIELELAQGVSQCEYDTEGNRFRTLISHLAIALSEKITYKLLREHH